MEFGALCKLRHRTDAELREPDTERTFVENDLASRHASTRQVSVARMLHVSKQSPLLLAKSHTEFLRLFSTFQRYTRCFEQSPSRRSVLMRAACPSHAGHLKDPYRDF